MREVIFKAKRLDNGEWIEGYYLFIDEKHYIAKNRNMNFCKFGFVNVVPNMIEIDHNTLGQFSCLLDKNVNKIFVGDILQREDGEKYWCFYNSNKGLFNLYFYENDPFDKWEREEVSINDFLRGGLEIIGNIHDKECE